MSNPKPAPKTAADHMADNKLSAEAVVMITSKQPHPDIIRQRVESWVLWRSRREAREAQEARIAREEEATRAFFVAEVADYQLNLAAARRVQQGLA